MSRRERIARLEAQVAELVADNDRLELDNLDLIAQVRYLTYERDGAVERIATLLREKQLGQFRNVIERALSEPAVES